LHTENGGMVGVKEPMASVQSSKCKVQSYPNPASGIVVCEFNIIDFQRVTLKIFDVHGREILVVLDKTLPAGGYSVQFDLSGLPDGIYFLRLTAGNETVTQKIIHSSFDIKH